MASTQLKAMQTRLHARQGTDVEYQQFVADPGNVNQTTNEIVDNEAAYPSSVTLKALITYNPSDAQRHALGLKDDVGAIIMVLADECSEKSITITVKDRFILPDGGPYYVDKIAADQQSGDEFLSYQVALMRKSGGRRNR